jgi:hypothetical protein
MVLAGAEPPEGVAEVNSGWQAVVPSELMQVARILASE